MKLWAGWVDEPMPGGPCPTGKLSLNNDNNERARTYLPPRAFVVR